MDFPIALDETHSVIGGGNGRSNIILYIILYILLYYDPIVINSSSVSEK